MKSRYRFIYPSGSKTKPWRGFFRLHGRTHNTINYASEKEAAIAVTDLRNRLWQQK